MFFGVPDILWLPTILKPIIITLTIFIIIFLPILPISAGRHNIIAGTSAHLGVVVVVVTVRRAAFTYIGVQVAANEQPVVPSSAVQ